MFFHHCCFNSLATTIFARNLVIHWFKRWCNKVANNNNCFSCETYSCIILRTFLYMRTTSWDFSLFHAQSLSEDSNKSAHLAVSLEPLPNRKSEFEYLKLLSFRIDVQIQKVQTHWLVDYGKLGCIWRLFIYLIFIFFIFYFILFYWILFFFIVRVSLQCKGVEDWGSISVYQAASFWTVYFSPGTHAGSDHDLIYHRIQSA